MRGSTGAVVIELSSDSDSDTDVAMAATRARESGWGREGGREREREGGIKREKEGGREREREGGIKRENEGGRERGSERESEKGREKEREGGMEREGEREMKRVRERGGWIGRTRRRGEAEDSDEECVMLDGDPTAKIEKGMVGEGGREGEGESGAMEGEKDEEIVVVGEKGVVACRDYPHARHDCAKFSFASSDHSLHCKRCYCYVCDCLAPCSQWEVHCHANDKERNWKLLRNSAKRKAAILPPLRPSPDPSLSLTLGPTTALSHSDPPFGNSRRQVHASRGDKGTIPGLYLSHVSKLNMRFSLAVEASVRGRIAGTTESANGTPPGGRLTADHVSLSSEISSEREGRRQEEEKEEEEGGKRSFKGKSESSGSGTGGTAKMGSRTFAGGSDGGSFEEAVMMNPEKWNTLSEKVKAFLDMLENGTQLEERCMVPKQRGGRRGNGGREKEREGGEEEEEVDVGEAFGTSSSTVQHSAPSPSPSLLPSLPPSLPPSFTPSLVPTLPRSLPSPTHSSRSPSLPPPLPHSPPLSFPPPLPHSPPPSLSPPITPMPPPFPPPLPPPPPPDPPVIHPALSPTSLPPPSLHPLPYWYAPPPLPPSPFLPPPPSDYHGASMGDPCTPFTAYPQFQFQFTQSMEQGGPPSGSSPFPPIPPFFHPPSPYFSRP